MASSSPSYQLSTAVSACVTTVVSEQYVMEWSLEDFGTVAEQSEQGSRLTSSDFTWSNRKHPMWRLFIYPAGLLSQNQSPAPINLKISTFPRAEVHLQDEIRASIRISTITDDGKSTAIDQARCEFHYGLDNSGDIFFNIDRCFILNSIRRDGSLTIHCDITIFSVSSRPYSNETIAAPVLPKVSVPKGYHDAMKSLLITGFGSDFIVQVDTTELRVHRAILASHSPVFRAMFDTGFDEAVKDRMNIVDFSPAAVKQLVNYLYTGAVEMLTNEVAFELLGLADKYEIRPLKHISQKYLCQNINSRNLISALIHSDLYKANCLKKTCQEFILSNANLILKSKSWIDLKVSHPELVDEALEAILQTKMLTADEDCGGKHGKEKVHSRSSNSGYWL